MEGACALRQLRDPLRVAHRRRKRHEREDRQVPDAAESAGAVTEFSDRVRRFHELHERGCFVIPNPWDRGSARLLAQLGFAALATTSAGFAWSMGHPDQHVELDDVLEHLRGMCRAVDLPVSADFEGGFGIAPDSIAGHVTHATTTGIAGLSIEDSSGDAAEPLFEFGLAVDRIK